MLLGKILRSKMVRDGGSELHATALNVADALLCAGDSAYVMNVNDKIDRLTHNISIIHMPRLSSIGGVDPIDGILEAIALVYVLHHMYRSWKARSACPLHTLLHSACRYRSYVTSHR